MNDDSDVGDLDANAGDRSVGGEVTEARSPVGAEAGGGAGPHGVLFGRGGSGKSYPIVPESLIQELNRRD